MKLRDLGEYRLIHQSVLPVLGRQALLGDDCGWMALTNGRVLLVSTDAVVENSHYRNSWMSAEDLARKALRTALSDIAAMGGGDSLGAVVAMGRRASSSSEEFGRFVRALRAEARRWGVKILGGDLTQVGSRGDSSDEFAAVTVFGLAHEKSLLKRRQAQAGEFLWLSGPIGLAQAGLQVLEESTIGKVPAMFQSLARYQKYPVLRLLEGTRLSARQLSRCAMDLSDSLAVSLLWISSQSKVALEVNLRQIPIPRILEQWARRRKKKLADYLLFGGEDYELLFTSSSSPRIIKRHLPQSYCIGRVLKGKPSVSVFDLEGKIVSLKPGQTGYEAFQV